MIEMAGLVDGVKCFPAWSAAAAKSCDSCKTTGPMLFCQSHSAFLCVPCDDKIHGGGARHARELMCEVCEQAPATVSCKADAAALCFTCDRDIHSANPLARRHERISLVPLVDCGGSAVRSTTASFLFSGATDDDPVHDSSDWILPTGKTAGEINPPDMKSIEQLFSDADQLLDFDCAIPTDPRLQGTDSVVPVQSRKPPVPAQAINHSPEKYFEINFSRSGINSYGNSYNPQSVSHSVSSSSMDVGVVPEGNSMSDISYPFGLQMNVAVENQAPALSSSDREARVVRYREKRKNRKFEKTIRYASRKAYAETRPRIKGRFAKRNEGDGEVDRWCTPVGTGGGSARGHVGDAEFGVVPSF